MRVGNHMGSGCGTCLKVCPWNKSFTPLHRFVNWLIRNIPASHKLFVKADDWYGYGKKNYKNKWWLDFEDLEEKVESSNKNKTGKPVEELMDMMN